MDAQSDGLAAVLLLCFSPLPQRSLGHWAYQMMEPRLQETPSSAALHKHFAGPRARVRSALDCYQAVTTPKDMRLAQMDQ
jgi:hypothetical protein